nr:mitotic spindle checkpoint component mad2 [Quercus suber]
MTSIDEQVKAYIKKIMSQLNKWMSRSKISKLVIVITSKETGEHVERWQFDVNIFGNSAAKAATISTAPNENASSAAAATQEKTDAEIQLEIQSLFRQITASVTFLPMLDGNCTFNVLVYADADSEVPLEWGDSDAKEVKNAEKVMLRSFSTNSHRIDTVVSYRYVLLFPRALISLSQETSTEERDKRFRLANDLRHPDLVIEHATLRVRNDAW